MRLLRLATCLWPGLPQLWLAGSYAGLALATGFALLVDLVLVSTLAWTELMSSALAWGAWSGVSIFWLVSVWNSLQWLLRDAPPAAGAAGDALFREAQSHYLRGSWFEAEVALGRLIERQPRDAEARLLMAALYRHCGRLPEAETQLRLLEKLDGSVKWQMEIRQERALLDEARQEGIDRGDSSDELPWSESVSLAPAA